MRRRFVITRGLFSLWLLAMLDPDAVLQHIRKDLSARLGSFEDVDRVIQTLREGLFT